MRILPLSWWMLGTMLLAQYYTVLYIGKSSLGGANKGARETVMKKAQVREERKREDEDITCIMVDARYYVTVTVIYCPVLTRIDNNKVTVFNVLLFS